MPPPFRADAVVVGAGVAGLTTAHCLADEGLRVRVVARERSPRTTSDVAAAVWYPFRAGRPEVALAWCARTYEALAILTAVPEAGVTMVPGIELLPEVPEEEPWWRPAVPALRAARPEEIPAGFAAGWVFDAPVVRMPVYLAWLERRLTGFGVVFEERGIDDLDTLFDEAPIVVNATGLGSRALVGDGRLRPVRGQIVRVAPGAVSRFVQADADPRTLAYVIPRPDCIVLGGTADDDAWDLEVVPETAQSILARCVAIEPKLRGATVLSHAVGLRPYRDEVRVEAERRPGGLVVHNYGHGGAGVTLSWGCAEAAARLVTSAAGSG